MGSNCMLVVDAVVGANVVVVGIDKPMVIPGSSRIDTQNGDDDIVIIIPTSLKCRLRLRLLRRNLVATGTKQHEVVAILAGAGASSVITALVIHLSCHVVL